MATRSALAAARHASPDPELRIGAAELFRIAWELSDRGIDAVEVGRVIASRIEAMTRELLDRAIERLGAPPAPWAWLSLGSAARQEQAILTDQDHAIAFDPGEGPLEEIDAYFLELARIVTEGMEAAGIPRCHAGVVAVNRSLRRPLGHWVEAFETWMDDAGSEAGRQTSILFDVRQVAGPLDAEPILRTVIAAAGGRPRFLRRLARQALDVRPSHPRGWSPWRLGRSHARIIDLKRQGITPLVNLARSFALEAGVPVPGTLERLALAGQLGRIDLRVAVELADAHRLLWRVRLEHQLARVQAGAEPDDVVDLGSLDPSTRLGIAAALRSVRRARRSLRREHRLLVA
jgi:CBS domain-containing protein